ncbi:histone-fold-containing protein [Sphaerosporella brunnea]|uniref:Histone H4 n=1 Tax=Sphaerosporella brunnea TaxID=1250544 RepID=A0A5J5EWG0_9PEZI|nr:histone-fold-containing protein [Sphaerosporella brunnea]
MASTPKGIARSTTNGGKGKGKIALGGLGRGFARNKHRKILKDTVQGISKGDLRRLARRGGVKRISMSVYEEMRASMKMYLVNILRDCVTFVEHGNRKTVTTVDVVFALKRIGRPIYGFDDAQRLAKRR